MKGGEREMSAFNLIFFMGSGCFLLQDGVKNE